MEFSDALRSRRMVRAFSTEPVPRETALEVCDAGRRAPSAGFSQGVRVVLLPGEEFFRVAFSGDRSCFGWPGVFNAAWVLVPMVSEQAYRDRYAEPDKSSDPDGWTVPYPWVDAGMAIENMLLAVADLNLGAVFFRLESTERLLEHVSMTPEWKPAGAIAIGHPSPDDRPSLSVKSRSRLTLDEFVVQPGG